MKTTARELRANPGWQLRLAHAGLVLCLMLGLQATQATEIDNAWLADGSDGAEVSGVLNFCLDGGLAPDEIGVSEAAFRDLGLPEGAAVEATHTRAPESVERVRRKLRGERLTCSARASRGGSARPTPGGAPPSAPAPQSSSWARSRGRR